MTKTCNQGQGVAQENHSLTHLSDYTYAELDRLMEIDSSDTEALKLEISRAKAVERLVKAQTDVTNTAFEGIKLKSRLDGSSNVTVPRGMIAG